MAMTPEKLAALAALNKQKGTDQTQASVGFTSETPEEGACTLRLIDYIELGQHEDEYQGEKKTPKQVYLNFEVSGPKWPAENPETGRTKPFTIGFTLTLSNSDRATFHKLFTTMAQGTDAKHMMELLGHPFVGEIIHNKSKDGKKTYANLNSKAKGYTIKPAFDEIPNRATGGVDRIPVEVPELVSPIRCFLWDFADKEQWDSIFIDGITPAKTDEKTGEELYPARSKNWLQGLIRNALNFKGSPIADVLEGAGELDLPDAEVPARKSDKPKTDEELLAEKMGGGAAQKESYDLNDDIPF